MRLARQLAEQSECKRHGVGCVLIDLTTMKMVGCGWNQCIVGECTGVVGSCGCLHAEEVASYMVEEAHIYGSAVALVTISPCLRCARILHALEVTGIIYDTVSRHGVVGEIPQISYGEALDKIPAWWKAR